MPRLIGQRIMLREYRRDDLKSIRSWVNDPAVTDPLSDMLNPAQAAERAELSNKQRGRGEFERLKQS